MSEKPDNPPAFPQSLSAEGPFGGMSLRDYFAGQALAATVIRSAEHETAIQISDWAYNVADAMLLARAKMDNP
jgi:hypothetical protein